METKEFNLDYATKEVQRIKDFEYDDETAHVLEDDLYTSFIMSIIDGNIDTIESAKEIAKEIIKTQDFNFSRWYA